MKGRKSLMKILSYNVYGVQHTPEPIPNWNIRQYNIEKILNELLTDEEIKVCCFQEVNENNMQLIKKILDYNNFEIVGKFPMKTETIQQYNIVALKSDDDIELKFVYCLPHGKDDKYVEIDHQIIDYDMSDYRTTVFISFIYNDKKYLIGNTHTDYISTIGKVAGVVKSLNYMDLNEYDYKLIVGDMNMVSHMSEVYNILKQNNNYVTLSRNRKFDISDNSWHGYGTKEQVNVDFAFVEKEKVNHYDYKIIKQNNIMDEGSDHRPIMITIE